MNFDTCRWCNSFEVDTTRCKNKKAFDFKINIESFFEDGDLFEAIVESFDDFKELRTALARTKLSKDAQDNFYNLYMDSIKPALVAKIDSSVSASLRFYLGEFSSMVVLIRDPDSFYCKHFW